jgi:integrase
MPRSTEHDPGRENTTVTPIPGDVCWFTFCTGPRARRRTVGRSFGNSEPSAPRDLALPNVAIPEQLVVRVVEAGKDQSWGDVVTILATTALRISEVSGLRVGDVDLIRGLIHVLRQTYPASSGHGLHLLHQSRVERRDELIQAALGAGHDLPGQNLAQLACNVLRKLRRWK